MLDFLPPATKIKNTPMYIGSNYSPETSEPGMSDKGEKGAKKRRLGAEMEHYCVPAASLGQFHSMLTATSSAASGPQTSKSNRNSKALPSSSGLPASSLTVCSAHHHSPFQSKQMERAGQQGLAAGALPPHAVTQAP